MYTLTKLDVTAMRKADRIVFRHTSGVTSIECIKEIKPNNDPFAETETRHVFTVNGRGQYGGLTGYGDDNAKSFTAFDMIHSAQYSDEWKTVASLLRAGDELKAEWFASAGNQYAENAVSSPSDDSGPWNGLHHDWLCLVATRGERKLTFRVADSICPNNTARMIQPIEYRLKVA